MIMQQEIKLTYENINEFIINRQNIFIILHYIYYIISLY